MAAIIQPRLRRGWGAGVGVMTGGGVNGGGGGINAGGVGDVSIMGAS